MTVNASITDRLDQLRIASALENSGSIFAGVGASKPRCISIAGISTPGDAPDERYC
jgi:hypothetical protein